jgi:hypothetical protein
MHSSEQTKWVGIGRYKLALVVLGGAVILLSLAILGPLEIAGDQTSSGASVPMTGESFADMNPRFLESNVLPEAARVSGRRESRPPSLAHSHFLDMNLLPGDSVSETGEPIQLGRPH